jgi:Do/DeqQ family serine protease
MNMKLKHVLLVMAVSAVSAIGSVWIYGKIIDKKSVAFTQQTDSGKMPVNYVGFRDGINAGASVDFTKASEAAVQAVVHIKTKIPAKQVSNGLPRSRNRSFDDFFQDFFNFGPQVIPEQRASGSGVIISEDGYIVTNNHVISDGGQGVAEELNVTLNNKKTYKARLIGRDPSSDLAVLKIDGKGLPFMLYGNSDNLKLGQWVLAVGYPLSLETTVTAGIVSAKGRTIGINSRQSQTPIESFIQTDAAINQGNSGGALINTDGQLVGINSAINGGYSGTYIGYGFAIPVNIVKKIVNDLIQYGDVKRGYLGISYIPDEDTNEREVKKAGVSDGAGVYVSAVPNDGAASAAGIKKGDVITKVNNTNVSNGLEMSGQIAQFKPGDKVPVTYVRSGKEYVASVVLKESAGKLEVVTAANIEEKLGGTLENFPRSRAAAYGVEGGVIVKSMKAGGALKASKMEDGFVITSVNGNEVTSIDVLTKLLSGVTGTVKLEGFYPGYDGTYTYPLNLGDD